MCGRYASSRGADYLVEHFDADPPSETLAPSWNVAPTDPTYLVIADGRRRLTTARWGIRPRWSPTQVLINARAETVTTSPTFRDLFRTRRALVPADGYFEWTTDGTAKQPWFLSRRDQQPLAVAALHDDTGCTLITTSAPDDLAHIHARTPLLVPREHWGRWLTPDADAEDLLTPGTPGVLDAWPVDTAVGNVRNNGAHLVRPVAQQLTLLDG